MSDAPAAGVRYPGGRGEVKNLARARVLVGLAAPVGVAIVGALGWVILVSFKLPYQPELLAAVIIGLVAGMLAIVPMLALMGRGAAAVVRLTMLAMLLRMGLTFAGLVLAFGPGWKLDHGVLVVCVAACYVAVMATESAATILATRP